MNKINFLTLAALLHLTSTQISAGDQQVPQQPVAQPAPIIRHYLLPAQPHRCPDAPRKAPRIYQAAGNAHVPASGRRLDFSNRDVEAVQPNEDQIVPA